MAFYGDKGAEKWECATKIDHKRSLSLASAEEPQPGEIAYNESLEYGVFRIRLPVDEQDTTAASPTAMKDGIDPVLTLEVPLHKAEGARLKPLSLSQQAAGSLVLGRAMP